jgi:hypothetical protein
LTFGKSTVSMASMMQLVREESERLCSAATGASGRRAGEVGGALEEEGRLDLPSRRAAGFLRRDLKPKPAVRFPEPTHALRRLVFDLLESLTPNQSPEPTPTSVTPRAYARVAPAAVVAHL